MELTKQEVAAVETTSAEGAEVARRELCEVELALVGGGCGDVQWN